MEKDKINYKKIYDKLNVSPEAKIDSKLIKKVRKEYIIQINGIIDNKKIKEIDEKLGSSIEPLLIVDENDFPIINDDGSLKVEFRKDFKSSEFITETPMFCRIVLFIMEDKDGNVIVSRRSFKKSHPGMLEIPGGHVIAGQSYLETVYKEIEEELDYKQKNGEITAGKDFLFKYKNYKVLDDNKYGSGNIISVYKSKVPDVNDLNFDKNEIEELITLKPEELLEAILTGELNGVKFDFAKNHAYRYLDYLETSRGINTKDARDKLISEGVMKNRVKFENL